MRRTRVLVSAALVTALAIGSVACTDDSPSDRASGGGAIDQPKEVVLVTYDGYALPEAAAAAFTEQTGATHQGGGVR